MCFLIWCIVTSYNYIYITEIIDGKDEEVYAANRNYEELENQYIQLKNDIQKSAIALEQRQLYIEQLIDEGSTETTMPISEETDADSSGDEVEDEDLDDYDKEARNSIRNENLDKIYVDLKRLEMEQNKTVKSLSETLEHRLSFVKSVLEKAGIQENKILELASSQSTIAQGGPFIELKNGINDSVIDSQPFDDLYIKKSNLKDLEMAIAFLPIAIPAEKYYISSKFGVRRDPITKKWASHKGLDLAGWHKTPINAGGDGVVTRAGRNGSFGLFIEIDHGNGFRSRYGHLSQVKVNRGDKVVANQLIGLMGSTGRSVSTHLHYEIWFNGKPIDPLKVIKAAKDVQKINQQNYDS